MSGPPYTQEISGYLLKWTNVIKGYQKRWFLVKDGLLSYYRNPESVGRRCRGTFDLSNAILSAPQNQTSFVITETTGRKHHLKALNGDDKARWIHILSGLMNKPACSPESDTYSEDTQFPPNFGPKTQRSSSRHRRLFHSRSRNGQKLSFRHSSSPNLPQRSGANHEYSPNTNSPPTPKNSEQSMDNVPRVMHSPRTLSDSLRFGRLFEAVTDGGRDSTARNNDPNFPVPFFKMRQSSAASAELTALNELVSAVETFRRRVNKHTSSVYTQISAVENLLSSPEVDQLLTMLSRNHPNSINAKDAGPGDLKQLTARLLLTLQGHRASLKEFHATYSEALTFLETNFQGWYQRIQTEQERCVGLERTVEQLARQHRALEIQLSQCYPYPADEFSFDGTVRSPRGRTLSRDIHLSRTGTLNRETHPSDHSGDEEDQFFDAQSALSGEQPSLTNELPPDPKLLSKLLTLPRTEGVRASATSLHSLVDADESTDSDSVSEEQAHLKRRILDSSPLESATPSRRVSSTDVPSSKTATLQSIPPGRQRRTSIRPSPKIALNLWSIIKNGIGKDLTKFPIPVNFNEPISFLQRAAEDLTYSQLLDTASQLTDPAEQMACIAAFSVSCYATTAIRTGKPFNPLLGETYELDRSDDPYGWRLIAEQVSHHPPGSALYCESTRYGWKIWVEFVLVSKFRGKYMSVIPKGTVNLVLPDGSRYTWTKATTVVHNLIVGSLWIDNYGDVLIRNHTNGYTCPMRFIAHSYFTRGPPKQVTGVVQNPNGNPVRLVRGMWDSHIETQDVSEDGTPSGEARILWTALPVDPEAEKMYYFSQFTIELNEPETNVAPTDSRRRPDQRLMEDGLWDQANEEKRRLEQKQRAKRHRWEEQQASGIGPSEPLFTPVWFVNQVDPITGEESHVYRGNYWEAKAKQDWSGCPDIY